jgi:hypothetical protein
MFPADDDDEDEGVWYWREFEMVDDRVLVIVYGLMDGSFFNATIGYWNGMSDDGVVDVWM